MEARHSRSHTEINYSLSRCREETVSCRTSCPSGPPGRDLSEKLLGIAFCANSCSSCIRARRFCVLLSSLLVCSWSCSNLAALSRNAAHSQAHCRPHLLGTGRIARFISDCSMIWHHTGKYGLRTYAYATPLTTKATLRWPRSPAYN